MWGDVVGMADKQPRSNALDTRVPVHPTPVHYVVKRSKSGVPHRFAWRAWSVCVSGLSYARMQNRGAHPSKSIPTHAVPNEVVLASSLPTITREGATACGIVRKPGDIISVVLNPID